MALLAVGEVGEIGGRLNVARLGGHRHAAAAHRIVALAEERGVALVEDRIGGGPDVERALTAVGVQVGADAGAGVGGPGAGVAVEDLGVEGVALVAEELGVHQAAVEPVLEERQKVAEGVLVGAELHVAPVILVEAPGGAERLDEGIAGTVDAAPAAEVGKRQRVLDQTLGLHG